MLAPSPPTIDDVRAAAKRIEGRVVRTPVLRCEALDAVAGAELWLKAENLQRIGAFKARGAMHAIGRLDPEARRRGIITFSSGNHGQAVAWAAREHGVGATIAMPTDAPRVKVDAVRALGAEIVFAGTTSDERKVAAERIAESTGGAVIEPFDAPDIIAGAGTATLELFEQVEESGSPALDAIVVPVGGGGLLAGACLVAEAAGVPVYAVEPRGCDSLRRSLEAGRRVPVSPGPTLADGLKPVCVGALNFEIASRVVREAFVVDDEDLGRALVRVLLRTKTLVEPSGAAAVSVALRERLPGSPRRVGVLLSGGNVDGALVADLLTRHGADA
jgi:threo-3-hydroxy-L-aspartate ammonia-lyase